MFYLSSAFLTDGGKVDKRFIAKLVVYCVTFNIFTNYNPQLMKLGGGILESADSRIVWPLICW